MGRRCLVAVALVLLPGEAAANTWTWFASLEGEYAVELPAPPERTETTTVAHVAGRAWSLETVTYAVRRRWAGRAYGVTHATLPANLVEAAGGPAAAAEDRLRAAASDEGATVVRLEREGIAGRPGARLEARGAAGAILRARAAVFGDRFVMAWTRGPSDEGAERFLASFRPGPPAPVTVRAKRGGFEATLPGPVTRVTTIIPAAGGIWHKHRHAVWVDRQRFQVAWLDLDPKPSGAEAALDTAQRALLREAGGRLEGQRPRPGGRDLDFRLPDGTAGRARLLYHDGRLYEITVFTAPRAPATPLVDQLFASLRLAPSDSPRRRREAREAASDAGDPQARHRSRTHPHGEDAEPRKRPQMAPDRAPDGPGDASMGPSAPR